MLPDLVFFTVMFDPSLSRLLLSTVLVCFGVSVQWGGNIPNKEDSKTVEAQEPEWRALGGGAGALTCTSEESSAGGHARIRTPTSRYRIFFVTRHSSEKNSTSARENFYDDVLLLP